MSRGRHARDGQRRDAIRARARDTWTRLRAWVRRLASPEFGHMALPFDYTALRAEIAAIRATMTPAPDWKPGQEKPRPVDPPRVGRGDEVRAGATPQTPGAVNADSGTRPRPAGTVPARQPEAGAPPAPAAAPAPPPPKAPGPGQPLPAWRGDYAPTQPFRAIPDGGQPRVSPYYQRHETLLDKAR